MTQRSRQATGTTPAEESSPLRGRYLASNPFLRALMALSDLLLAPLRTQPSIPAQPPRRVLLSIGGHLGDAVIATAAIRRLADALGVRLIAEGIESREQLDYLRAARCEEGQGYLFSRPLPSDELTALLAAGRVGSIREISGRAENCSLLAAVRDAAALTTVPEEIVN